MMSLNAPVYSSKKNQCMRGDNRRDEMRIQLSVINFGDAQVKRKDRSVGMINGISRRQALGVLGGALLAPLSTLADELLPSPMPDSPMPPPFIDGPRDLPGMKGDIQRSEDSFLSYAKLTGDKLFALTLHLVQSGPLAELSPKTHKQILAVHAALETAYQVMKKHGIRWHHQGNLKGIVHLVIKTPAQRIALEKFIETAFTGYDQVDSLLRAKPFASLQDPPSGPIEETRRQTQELLQQLKDHHIQFTRMAWHGLVSDITWFYYNAALEKESNAYPRILSQRDYLKKPFIPLTKIQKQNLQFKVPE